MLFSLWLGPIQCDSGEWWCMTDQHLCQFIAGNIQVSWDRVLCVWRGDDSAI